MKCAVLVVGILMTMLIIPLKADTIPEEARNALFEGVEIIKKAKGVRDYLEAEERFEKALAHAPQWADAYYNLAILAEELGKEVKAIKFYEKYLELSGDTPERSEILSNMERLKKARQIKKEIGLVGINLITLKDGIYVRGILSGSKLAKAGFQAGDKIVEVNKRSTAGIKLDEFYKLMKMAFENPMLGARIQAYGRNTKINIPVAFQIIRGGSPRVIVAPLDTFKTRIFEIEEDEINDEVLKADKPVLLFFWADWCAFCRELIPILEELADKYSESIKIVTISADFNKKASKKFEIKAVPHAVYFKNGEKIGSLTGKRTREEIENFVRIGIDKKA